MVYQANDATIPRSEKTLGRADCLVGDAVGDIVYITGDKVANRYQVAKADPTSVNMVPAVASIIKKPFATQAIIQFHGPLKAIYAGLSSGTAYFLGTDGTPAAVGDGNYPASADYIQQIGIANDATELFLNIEEAAIAGAGNGVTEGQHEVLDTLVHKIAETSFSEYGYTGQDLTRVTVWATNAMLLKVRESILSYTGSDLTGIVLTQFDGVGTAITTLTKTLGYTGADLTSIDVVRT